MLKLLFLSALLLFPNLALGAEWERINEEDGVTVYKKSEEGSPIVEFKGEGLVREKLEKVATVLFDTKRANEWADSLEESRIDHWINDHEWIEYDHVHAPLFISDRDFVTDVSGEVDKGGFEFLFTYKSVDDPNLPETNKVRGIILHGLTGVKSAPEGSFVSMEAKVDPRGAIPHFIVNMVQKEWAVKTFRGLRKQVQKPDIKIDPFIEKLLAKRTPQPLNSSP